MLVAARGRVVPADRIVDQVWGGEPPASATATLQAYVSRLRRLLEPDRPPRAAPSILISEAAGYALRLPTAAVDAWRFERDVTLSGDLPPQQAIGVLREALDRWRGVPYEQFADEQWARAEVARLSDLRRPPRSGASPPCCGSAGSATRCRPPAPWPTRNRCGARRGGCSPSGCGPRIDRRRRSTPCASTGSTSPTRSDSRRPASSACTGCRLASRP
jgi:hypothetical protein